jgi:hypothetical protein
MAELPITKTGIWVEQLLSAALLTHDVNVVTKPTRIADFSVLAAKREHRYLPHFNSRPVERRLSSLKLASLWRISDHLTSGPKIEALPIVLSIWAVCALYLRTAL